MSKFETPDVLDPQTKTYEPAMVIDTEGKRRGTIVVMGMGATAEAVFYPGDVPAYVNSHPSLINASSSDQFEKHGFGD